MADSKVVTAARLSAFKGHVTRAIKACAEELDAVAPSTGNLNSSAIHLLTLSPNTKNHFSFLKNNKTQPAIYTIIPILLTKPLKLRTIKFVQKSNLRFSH